MDFTGIIYKATNNINGKVYIGQTVRSLGHRKTQHKNSQNTKFSEAIKKHGFDNFSWEIIKRCFSREEMDKEECYWIDFYKSNDRELGYNVLSGGRGAALTPEIIEVLRQKSRKFLRENPMNFTAEIRFKQSEGQKAFYRNNPEERSKISDNLKTRYKNRKASIQQAAAWGNHGFFAMKNGTSYGAFYTYKEAANFIGCSISGVKLTLDGKRNSCLGYKFYNIYE